MCIDWKAVQLKATEFGPEYQTIDIMLMPCGSDDTLYGGIEPRIPDDCNFDRQKMLDYLGPLQMLIWKNVGRFQLDEFGNRRIQKESVVTPI